MRAQATTTPVGEATEFLTSFSNLLSVTGLYPSEHPARGQSLERCWSHLQPLLAREEPHFSFLDNVVLYGSQLMHHLRSWELGLRLHEAGIQRIEFRRGVDAQELGELAERLHDLLAGGDAESIEEAESAFPHIGIGAVALRAKPRQADDTEGKEAAVLLNEEVEIVQWVYEAAAEDDRVPAAEVRLAVASLSSVMHNLHRWGAGMVAIKSHDQYTAIHCINVSILAMTFAERLGFLPDEIRLIGEAGLLHDIGKTKIPDEVLNKPGKLTPEERTIIEQHTVEGCRLAMEPPFSHWLAATVAYEHHMADDDKGYPATTYERKPHPVSRLVQVCDVYDALRTRRPFRAPVSGEESLKFLKDRAGSLLHKGLVRQFVKLVDSGNGDLPHLQPEIGFSDASEREAVRAQEIPVDAGASPEPNALSAAEPAAVIDWLAVLDTP